MKIRDMNWQAIRIALLVIAFWVIVAMLLTSCGQVVKKDAQGNEIIKINWILYDWNLDKLAYKDLLIEEFDAKAKNVKAYTPSGVVIVTDSNSN